MPEAVHKPVDDEKIDGPVKKLILASGSETRRGLLKAIGLSFAVIPADCNEQDLLIKAHQKGLSFDETACFLAAEKALIVSKTHRDAFIIGADQLLIFENKIFSKAKSLLDAEKNLLAMVGKSHFLISAAALAHDGKIIWQDSDRAKLTMRALNNAAISQYLHKMGPDSLKAVGSYFYEGLGFHLFDHVEGAFHTVLGLPLEKLVSALRDHAQIDPISD